MRAQELAEFLNDQLLEVLRHVTTAEVCFRLDSLVLDAEIYHVVDHIVHKQEGRGLVGDKDEVNIDD